MSEMIHLHIAYTIFHNRRGHLRTEKASKLDRWRFAADPTGELTALPSPWWGGGSELPCSQPFDLRNWGPGSNLLLNQGPSEPSYATD